MPRPTSKIALLKASQTNFEALQTLITSMPQKARQTVFDFSESMNKTQAHWARDKNLRDVLIHLYEWHQLLIHFIEKNTAQNDKKNYVGLLPKSYTFKTTPELNMSFWEKHQQTDYDAAVALLNTSHQEVMKLIERFDDEELFTKQYFPWTGTTSLGSYCVSATSSHYDWAIKKIKAHIKMHT